MINLEIAPIQLKSGLHLVATPIGNLRDITLRALDVLNAADVIYCEDTRVTGKLLKAYNIQAPLKIYNDHSDEHVRSTIVTDIQNGQSIALVSDAGMPLVSDPGYKLVRDCVEQGVMVTSIPGASAGLMALQLSGLPSDAFSFLGFLPSKTKARQDILNDWSSVQGSLILYENGSRLLGTLKDIEAVLGARSVCVARELTKLYEESRHGCVDELIAYYENIPKPKGEIVIIVGEGEQQELSEAEIEDALRAALKTMRVKQAAEFVSLKVNRPKSELYDMALKVKNDG
jgi:16S rRNA (cytidine1402-2'-O)-methyltransferase